MRDNAKDLILGIVYRPPGGNTKLFCNYLKKTLEEIGNNFNKDMFILGDKNINYSNPHDQFTKQLLEFEQFTGLKQLIRNSTRGQNCIDLIFSNSNDIANANVFPMNISDHDLIFVTKKKACKNANMWDSRAAHTAITISSISKHNNSWEAYWNLVNPNDCWTYILGVIEREISIMCPLKTRKVRCSNEPWMTNGIFEAIHDKDLAWRQA